MAGRVYLRRDLVFLLFLIADVSGYCQSPTAPEADRLKAEVTALRAENQLLRQLITQGVTAPVSATAQLPQPAPQAHVASLPSSSLAASQSPAVIIQAQAPATRAQAADQTALHWITLSSGKRHNSRCRWFGTTHGRPCGADEGTPCLKCGG